MRLKTILWIVGTIATIVVTHAIMLVIVLVADISWWWLGGTSIFEFFALILGGVIISVIKFQKDDIVQIRQDPLEIEKQVIRAIQYDEDNPDNFEIKDREIINVGDPAKPKTQILYLSGEGTEVGMKIDVLINLQREKLEMSRLIGKPKEYVEEVLRRMAENPETSTVEKITTTSDAWGRPSQTLERRTPSSLAEIELEDQKKEADFKNAF